MFNLPEYLVKLFTEIAIENNFIDFKFEYNAGSNHGDGFVAAMIGVTIVGNQKQSNEEIKPNKLALICKTIPDHSAQREMFSTQQIFAYEVNAYNNVLPALIAFQNEKNITNGFTQFPHSYRALSDIEQNQHAIIMEDLRAKNYALWNKLEPITYDHVRLLMIALGRYHGLNFAFRDQNPDLFNSFRPLPDLFLKLTTETESMRSFFLTACDKSIGLLQGTREGEILTDYRNRLLECLAECTGENVAEPFTIIGHGDCWNNNFMFQETKEICLLDWQVIRMCSPVLDLTYFFCTSTTKELRDQYFDEFVEIYYENLAEIIRKCGSDPERLFSFKNLQDEFKKFGKFGVIMSPILLNTIVTDPKDIVSVEEFAERSKEGKLDFATNDRSNSKLRERVIDVIESAIKYGWINP